MNKIYTLAACALVLSACHLLPNLDLAGMVSHSSPDSDERFEQSMAYNQSHHSENISMMAEEDDYRLYVCTDSHVDSTSYNVEEFVTAYKSDPRCTMALHLGDLINAQNNYDRFQRACETLPLIMKPMYIAVGNHDIYFKQWSEFVSRYHTSTYTITVTTPSGYRDYYICLDSSSGVVGTKQTAWLRGLIDQVKKENYRHIIVYTHTHVFRKDNSQGLTTNLTLEDTYELLGLMHKLGVDYVLMGHDHSREISCYNGTTYIVIDSMQDKMKTPFYMIMEMGEKISYYFLPLSHTGTY